MTLVFANGAGGSNHGARNNAGNSGAPEEQQSDPARLVEDLRLQRLPGSSTDLDHLDPALNYHPLLPRDLADRCDARSARLVRRHPDFIVVSAGTHAGGWQGRFGGGGPLSPLEALLDFG